MPNINPAELIAFQPVEKASVVYIIAKHSARFKVVDLSLFSLEQKTQKLEAYADRFVKVVEHSENAFQVFISSNAPHIQELMQTSESLTIQGRAVSQITLLNEAEYKDFSAEVVASIKAAQKELDVEKDSAEKKTEQAKKPSIEVSSTTYSAKIRTSTELLTAKVHTCFVECNKKILAIFIEVERRMAELDKEADKNKLVKRKELKKRLLKEDLLRDELRYQEIKAQV